VVIAAGQVNDVRLYRDLVASGIQDYLLKPFTPDQVRDAFANAQMTISGPRVNEPSAERPHVMASVIGVRGGVGASTIATSLAWLMGDKAGRSTALLDLDVHFGTGRLALDLEPGRGLTDAIENPSRIDGLFIERAMVRANDKLCVLSAEAPINQPLLTDGSAYHQLQEEMRAAFETTVIDLPRQMLVQHPHLVHDTHVSIVVVEFTLAATRDTIRILSWLKANAPQSRVIVVANKVSTGGAQEISRTEFEKSIERKVDVCIPLDLKAAARREARSAAGQRCGREGRPAAWSGGRHDHFGGGRFGGHQARGDGRLSPRKARQVRPQGRARQEAGHGEGLNQVARTARVGMNG
jgi:pilus assembly protein CpaE